MANVSVEQKNIGDRKMIFVGILLALAYWIMEALIHVFVFQEGEFLKKLFPTDPNELWMRTLVSCLLIAIAAYAHSSITKLKKSEKGRLKLQKELEKSLTKLLSGFICICAKCKDIREADGTWIPIEGYIQKHSDVQFTHGFCQKCMKALYPDHAAES